MVNENRAFLFKIDSPLSYYFLSVWVCLVTFREYFPAKFCKLINCLNQGGKGEFLQEVNGIITTQFWNFLCKFLKASRT